MLNRIIEVEGEFMKKRKVLLAALLFTSAMCLYAVTSKSYARSIDVYLSTGTQSQNPGETVTSAGLNNGSTGGADITGFNIIPDTITSPSYTIPISNFGSGGMGKIIEEGTTADALSPLRWFRATSE